jgi:hypothetical protein
MLMETEFISVEWLWTTASGSCTTDYVCNLMYNEHPILYFIQSAEYFAGKGARSPITKVTGFNFVAF